MARNFDLKKGEKFSLGKSDELSTIQVDLNWKSGADLDASAFLLNDDGVITEDADFVYYKSNFRSEPYDRTKFGSKKNWRDNTVPISSDGSVVGSADDTVLYPTWLLPLSVRQLHSERRIQSARVHLVPGSP